MPPRSKIDLMPKEIRAELDKRIVDGGFANYRGLAKWLDDNGYQIGKNAVSRSPTHESMLDHVLAHQRQKNPVPTNPAIRQYLLAFAQNLKPSPPPSPQELTAYFATRHL
jgi:uncharacterized protein DUF3486